MTSSLNPVTLTELLQGLFHLTPTQYNEELTVDEIANWDSLKHMELITELERNFQVEFEMLEIVEMRSIKSIKNTLVQKGVELV